MSDTAQPANEPENQNQPEGLAEERSERRPAGSLWVSDRTADAPVRWQSMADLVADRGFLEGRSVRVGWDEFRSLTWAGGTVLTDVNQLRREGVAMGYDVRWLYPALPTTTVGDDVTSVQYLRQSARSLAGTATIRPLDATSTKPETSSTVEAVDGQLQQVASIQTGIPRIHFNQTAFRRICETDLRYAVGDGLDEIARRGIALAGTIVKGTDDILEVTRKAITLIQADGYAPDTLAIDPQGAQALDLLRTPGSEKMYIFTLGQFAGGPWNLRLRVWKQAGTAVLDSQAYGRMYVAPTELRSFEADSGTTNKKHQAGDPRALHRRADRGGAADHVMRKVPKSKEAERRERRAAKRARQKARRRPGSRGNARGHRGRHRCPNSRRA